jgi:hypothetical protein
VPRSTRLQFLKRSLFPLVRNYPFITHSLQWSKNFWTSVPCKGLLLSKYSLWCIDQGFPRLSLVGGSSLFRHNPSSHSNPITPGACVVVFVMIWRCPLPIMRLFPANYIIAPAVSGPFGGRWELVCLYHGGQHSHGHIYGLCTYPVLPSLR